MKTLLLALISPGKSAGTREGSIRGLVGVGKEAVRKGLVDGGGAKVVASEFGDSGALVDSVMVCLQTVLPFRHHFLTDTNVTGSTGRFASALRYDGWT